MKKGEVIQFRPIIKLAPNTTEKEANSALEKVIKERNNNYKYTLKCSLVDDYPRISCISWE